MDKSSLFAAFSLVSVFIYMYVGIYTFRQNIKSIIHRFFLLLCTSYAIWSFAYAFAYVSNDRYVFALWNKVSAIGWCSFSAISLYLVLLITESRIIKKRIARVLIFSPAVLFLYMSVFLFGEGIKTSILVSKFFYIGDFLYNFTFLLLSIIVLFIWGLRTDSKRIKKQSKILVLSSIIPFCLNLLTQTIIPIFGLVNFPYMGQLYSVIMIIGIYIVITKYKFLRLPEKFLLEEIGNKIIEMVILLDEKSEIIKVSKHTLNLLNFEKDELLSKNISCLFDRNDKKKIDLVNIKKQEKKYNDIEILSKYGEKIPTNITYIPIFDNEIHDFIGAVLVIQDISIEYELRRKNEELQEKTIRDGLTKLYNHQYSVEIIKCEINKLNVDINKKELSLLMLDIDFFKNVNDTYGHLFGDYVLETVSNILVTNVNDKGYVGRFGGEEFIIILPQIGIDEAFGIGEKIRNEIEKYKFNKGLKITISIGIKQYRDESSVQLVKNADDLLYKAKENGRNRIEYKN
ncbi:diguanylate cyclase [Clostridium estertheticum]|uniref:histidine kinase N-terminal 7TM domain-containing diguanylate cyclase n=1 Tax=Clostridium estertheticum TaxID=238834 RepID=UPI0013E916F1|nr:diguanylate cyclase [Clostridium estertheticum]MBZ9686091.1 diguanylate cyclase [Clostridium estertheticum]